MNNAIRSFVLSLCLIFSAGQVQAWQSVDGHVADDAGQPIQLRGVNWFGFETQNHVVHGLWSRNWQDMIQQMKDLGFNAVRVPVCPGTLQGVSADSIDFSRNPDLQGLNSLELLDTILQGLDDAGMYILLDHHRPDCNAISELWYTESYSEQEWIDDLVFLAHRYKDLSGLVGIDLKNEPHGRATWGTGDSATDWNGAAERAAAAILAEAPDLLIFVEGIGENPVCSGTVNHWWGGNLEPVACFPLNIASDRLVLSPHVYGPDVYNQPYFNDPDFPDNMEAIWDAHFGYLMDQGYTVIIGEFGGKYGHGGDPRDKVWQDALVDYLVAKGSSSHFYWSWNPNSGDTGGILQDDWQNVWQDKVDLLNRLWNAGSGGEDFLRIGYLNWPAGGGQWSDFQQLFNGSYDLLIAAFLIPDRNGSLQAVDAALSFTPPLIRQARDAGTRVSVAIGGATVDYGVYVDIANDATARQRFIDNVLAAVRDGGYDGADMDFEGWWDRPGLSQADVDAVNDLILDLARALKGENYLATVALGGFWYLTASADCGVINDPAIDLALHMSYDFHVGAGGANGPFRRPGQTGWFWPGYDSAESSVYGALQYLIEEKGCDSRKLVGGLPFYSTAGTNWNDIRNSQNWAAVSLHTDYLEKQDPASGAWVNDPEAVAAKTRAYRQMGLAGVMTWQVGGEGVTGDLTAAMGGTLPPLPAACADGVDNDGDGLIDYPADPGCSSADDDDEYNVPSGSGVTAELVVTSDWGSGYCANVTVTNEGTVVTDWVVSLAVEGTINNLWCASYIQDGDQLTAEGLGWNNVLAPGQSTVFGFCAERPPEPVVHGCSDGLDNDGDGLTDYPADPGCSSADDDDEYNPAAGSLDTQVLITSDWGSGYCANVTVTNNGAGPADWAVTFEVDGQINNLWNAEYQQSGSQVSAEGVSWNNIIQPGQQAEFGFCASR